MAPTTATQTADVRRVQYSVSPLADDSGWRYCRYDLVACDTRLVKELGIILGSTTEWA